MVAKTRLGYGENVKDWAISRVFSTAAMIGYEELSETERVWVYSDGRPILNMLKIQSGLLGNLEDIIGSCVLQLNFVYFVLRTPY